MKVESPILPLQPCPPHPPCFTHPYHMPSLVFLLVRLCPPQRPPTHTLFLSLPRLVLQISTGAAHRHTQHVCVHACTVSIHNTLTINMHACVVHVHTNSHMNIPGHVHTTPHHPQQHPPVSSKKSNFSLGSGAHGQSTHTLSFPALRPIRDVTQNKERKLKSLAISTKAS